MLDPQTVNRIADLAVGFAANVQPGQVVAVSADVGKEALARAIAERADRIVHLRDGRIAEEETLVSGGRRAVA